MLIIQKIVYDVREFEGYEDVVQYVMFLLDVLGLNSFVVFLHRGEERKKRELALYAEIETCSPYMAVELTLYPAFFEMWKSPQRGAREFCRLSLVHEFVHALVEYSPGASKSDRIEALCDWVASAIQGLITNLAVVGMPVPSYKAERERRTEDEEQDAGGSGRPVALSEIKKEKEIH